MGDRQQDSTRLALLQAALDQIDQGFTVFDANLEMIGWNRRFFELLEFPMELAKTGTHFSAFMRINAERGEYGEGNMEALVEERVRRALEFRPHEIERRRPTGEIISVLGTPLPGGGFVTTYTDITEERKRQTALENAVAERTRALSESEGKLRLITDAVPALIAYIDENSTYRFANRRYAEWFGLTVDDITGKPIDEVIEKPILDQIGEYVAAALGGAAASYEYRRTGPDGRTADMRSTLIPDIDADDTVRGCFVLSLDVTEQKSREAALRQAQKMEAVGQLTGGIAHDFNNLLTVILGNLRTLGRKLEDADLREELLDPAIHAADRGAELTSRLLAFARERPLDAQPVDVETAIVSLSRLLRRSLPSTIEVSTNVRGLPPPAFVDPGQLDNALLNLALNARDAITGPGRIVFNVSDLMLLEDEARERALEPGWFVCVEVEDTGCGIAAETLPRLFDPFFTTKDFGMGSGLGLSMVYGFIRQSKGAIDIQSEPGSGTRATILLPVAEDAGTIGANADMAHHPNCIDEPRELVLLVEDDRDVRAVVRQQLTGLGYRVLEAENSEDALQLVGAVDEIRYVVSDIVMPGQLDGVALARSVKAAAPAIQVALITGFAGADNKDRLEECPFPVLAKPFTELQLSELIDRAV